jgi:hypothetical protein
LVFHRILAVKDKDEKRFERLKDYLSTLPAYFVLVYRRRFSVIVPRLKWCKAVARPLRTHEGYDKLAARYKMVAVFAFSNRRNLILQESVPRANSQGRQWCGFRVPKESNLYPPNSLGQRAFHLVVGSGATRRAGYVIVARLLAKDKHELNSCFAKIIEIMGG